MSRRVRLSTAAEQDLREARQWYRENAPHVDHSFRQSIRETLARIGSRPTLYPIVHQEVRRALVRRFPYSIFYRDLGSEVLVIAITHQARDPETWKRH